MDAHAAQLLRDLQLINERTVRELGPLPRDGLPVQVKRKPKRAPWEPPVVDTSTLDADAPAAPQIPHTETGGSAMVKSNDSFNEQPLPPVPVPQKLREMLKDYPELIERLQRELNYAVQHPSKVTPPFEWAIWMLEDELSSFIPEAREELEAAYASGDPEAIERAERKEFAVGYSRLNMGAMSDLASYFDGAQGHE